MKSLKLLMASLLVVMMPLSQVTAAIPEFSVTTGMEEFANNPGGGLLKGINFCGDYCSSINLSDITPSGIGNHIVGYVRDAVTQTTKTTITTTKGQEIVVETEAISTSVVVEEDAAAAAGAQTPKVEVTISSADELPKELFEEAAGLEEAAAVWENRKLVITVGFVALTALLVALVVALSAGSSGSGSSSGTGGGSGGSTDPSQSPFGGPTLDDDTDNDSDTDTDTDTDSDSDADADSDSDLDSDSDTDTDDDVFADTDDDSDSDIDSDTDLDNDTDDDSDDDPRGSVPHSPEPATILLTGLGLLIPFMRRKRKR